jgi:hypothetical protein
MIRRTITIDTSLNQCIQLLRAEYLRRNFDLDYTTAVNMLLWLGLSRLASLPTHPLSEDESKAIQAFLSNDQLKLAAAMDEMANRFSEAWNKALEPIIEKTIASLKQALSYEA